MNFRELQEPIGGIRFFELLHNRHARAHAQAFGSGGNQQGNRLTSLGALVKISLTSISFRQLQNKEEAHGRMERGGISE